MDRYIGTKVVYAERGPAPDHVRGDNKPGDDGYKVLYPDGYESWSPKDQFEEYYCKADAMSFGLAIAAMKMEHKVARHGWNGKGMFIVYMPPMQLPPYNTADTARKVNDRTAKFIGKDAPLDCQGYIAMYNAQNQWIPGWVASQSDMLSDDWYIVD